MRPDRIPLFPLNVVLFPGALLPLHIFEPRYREMTKRCLKNKSEFGMLLATSSGVSRVGCTAEITKVVKRHTDGRMDIVVVGRERFRVTELFSEDPLLEGVVDYLEDRELSSVADVQHELLALYETCHTMVFNDYPRGLEQEPAESFSFLVADKLPIDLLWKQQVLELRSEADRQERLVAYLRQWAPQLQKLEVLRKHAGSHGLN
ncbi:MAG: LON peptidase substrate-binding domain-containing protein [Candidatus Acidiferrum sp.]